MGKHGIAPCQVPDYNIRDTIVIQIPERPNPKAKPYEIKRSKCCLRMSRVAEGEKARTRVHRLVSMEEQDAKQDAQRRAREQ